MDFQGNLTHYLRKMWEEAGMTWDSDNRYEMEIMIEGLVGYVEATAVNAAVSAVQAHVASYRHSCPCEPAA